MVIILSNRARKALSRLDTVTKQRIKAAILMLPLGDVKKLVGGANSYRLRVGTWRILFEVHDTISVTDILPRGEAYKRL